MQSTIQCSGNGPLVVMNLKRLIGPDGEEVEVKEKVSLCRCGGSSRKPFCDASHKTNGFTDERERSGSIHEYRSYEGEEGEVVVKDNRTICAHAEYCVNHLPAVFRRDGKPWVQPDEAPASAIADLTRTCPSGALLTLREEEQIDHVETDVPTIRVMRSGPYHVEGGVVLEIDPSMAPPVAERYALCRCGASRNKPYCDGSHHKLPHEWDQ